MSSSGLSEGMLIALHDVQTTKFTAGGFSLLVYDSILVLEDERKYIWKTDWSVGKILYLGIRYITYLNATLSLVEQMHPSPAIPFCKVAYIFETFVGIGSLLGIHVVLALRTYALWHKDKRILWSLLFLAGAVAAVMWSFTGTSYYLNVWTENPLPGVMVGCTQYCENGCGGWHKYFHAVPLVYDFVVFFLTLWKTWCYSKEEVHTPLLKVIWRDGTIYFFMIVTVTLVNLVIWNFQRPSLLLVSIPYMRTFLFIMCSRLILNLRGMLLAGRPDQTQTSYSMGSIGRPSQQSTAIVFASSPWRQTLNACDDAFDDVDYDGTTEFPTLPTPSYQQATGTV